MTPNLTSKVLGEPQFSAYSFTAEGNVNYVGFYGLDKQLPWVETMMKGAHHLPEYTFMYLTSNSKINGRTTPPMIIEKDRVNFFVKPKEALQKPPLPSRMEQKCSVRLFLTTPECAVFLPMQ